MRLPNERIERFGAQKNRKSFHDIMQPKKGATMKTLAPLLFVLATLAVVLVMFFVIDNPIFNFAA